MQFQSAEYVRSAGSPEQFLHDPLPKVVFAGRSNVGKSSVINRLTGRKSLARVGASPGKTRQINYFLVDGKLYLTDLPGYGYAKVSKDEKERWAKLMERFFRDEGGRIAGGVLIVDIRHKPTADDLTMFQWVRDSGCPLAVAANKLDKLKKREIEPSLALIRETLRLRETDPLIPFSAEKGDGKEALTDCILSLCENP